MTKAWLDRIEAAWSAERGRVILWSPVLIAAGIAGYFSLTHEPDLWPLIIITVLLGLCLLVTRPAVAKLFLWALFLIALGFTAATWRTSEIAAPILERRMPVMGVTGTIAQVEWRSPKEARIEIIVTSLSRLEPSKWPQRIRVTSRTKVPQDLGLGDEVETLVLLWPPPKPSIPGDFDYGRDLFFNGIGALGVTVAPVVRTASADAPSFLRVVEQIRQTISQKIRAAIEGPTGALGDALVTGYRAAIPETLNQAMRDSGLFHLISISGLHMSMVVGIVFLVVRNGLALWEKVALRFPIKKWAAVIAAIVALGYLGISGASLPAQRSYFMAALILMAVLLDRQPLSLRFVAAAAILILLRRPESLLNVSFQMSFAAVFALIAVFGEISLWRERRRAKGIPGANKETGWFRRFFLGIAGLIFSSLIAELAIAPAALYHFHNTAIYGMVANLLAIPLTGTVVMPMLLLGVLMMPLGLEWLPLQIAGLGLDLVIKIGELVAAQPGATVSAPAFGVGAFTLIMFGGLWLLIWRSKWRFAGLGVVALGIWFALQTEKPDILIAGEDELFAVQAPDGSYWMPPGRKGAFIRKRWAAATNSQIERWSWAHDSDQLHDWLSCDSLGCLYRTPIGQRVAIVHNHYAFTEDCLSSLVVISALYAPKSCADYAVVIDRSAQKKQGGHSIRFVGPDGDLHIKTVGEGRNLRPWGGA